MATSELYSRFERRLVHLQNRQFEAGRIAVTYSRDGRDIDVEAVPAAPVGEEDAVEEATVQKEISRFLIRADELRMEGKPIRPRRGDKIVQTLPGRSVDTWTVLPERGEPEADYADATHLVWMVQVKLTNRTLL